MISRDMFLYALTYHQVMPEFLDFIFPFGWQEYQEDFYFSGFRGEVRLLGTERGLDISALERSGQDFRLCYALQSVEKSSQEGWPWSIRQTATYHSFEVDTGKMFWILVKGNELMKDRIQGAMEHTELKKDQIESTGRAFAVALETHLIICDWAGENWRWYINYLEKRLEDLTRHSLAIRITSTPGPMAPQDIEEPRSWITKRKKASSPQGGQSPPPPHLPAATQKPAQPRQIPSGEPEFSLHDLQEVQSVEDKVNQTVQVLINNTRILDELRDFYESLIDLQEFPDEIKTNCQQDIAKFSKRVRNIMNDLQMHKSRAETLLRLLANRKTLVCFHIQYKCSFYS
jgi:hypothetical protein